MEKGLLIFKRLGFFVSALFKTEVGVDREMIRCVKEIVSNNDTVVQKFDLGGSETMIDRGFIGLTDGGDGKHCFLWQYQEYREGAIIAPAFFDRSRFCGRLDPLRSA